MENKISSWFGPKQIGMMFYTAVLFLIGTSIIGGNNNTVYPMFAEIRGWDINAMNAVSGIACIMKAVGVIALAGVVRKIGAKKLTVATLIISAILLVIFGTTQNFPLFLVVMLVIGFLGGGYEKNGGMTRANGDRFREYILSVGNSVDLNKAFKDYTGKDPDLNPLLRNKGFIK